MITIKIPYTTNNEAFYPLLAELQREQSSVIRYGYNRLTEKMKDTPIRRSIKMYMKNLKWLNAWMIDSAIMEAKTIFSSKKYPIVFGGKWNLKRLREKKISAEDWKNLRSMKFFVSGEMLHCGNRNFRLDTANNQIIFKYKCKQHFILNIPKLRGEYKHQINYIEQASWDCLAPFSVKLDDKFIYLIFEPQIKPTTKKYSNRVFGIDMNPNEIGWSVLEFDKNEDYKIIDSGIVEYSKKSPRSKRVFEVYEISKFLASKANHYGCSKFSIEDLNIEAKNHSKGKNFNRLINNQWHRLKFESNLKKRCDMLQIELVKNNSAYSSFVGNTVHGQKFPDPICSSIEIARRGYKKFVKGWFYPKLVTYKELPNQWKKEVGPDCESWVKLYNRIKNVGLRYHFSWKDSREKFRVFRMKSSRSGVNSLQLFNV